MSTIIAQSRLCHVLQRSSSLVITKRCNTREAIHRYKEPDKIKKHMLAASEHYYKRKYILPSDSCVGSARIVHDLEPLQRIYADELLAAVKSNDFVLFIQHNYTPFQSERVYKNTLIKSGGLFYSHRNCVYKDVFANLAIDKIKDLFVARNSLVLGKLDKLPICVKALRKMPQFILLCGCIENEVYNLDQLELFSNTPDLDSSRATLASILDTPAVELYQNLKQYMEMNDEGSQNNVAPEASSASEVHDPTITPEEPSK